LLFAFMALFSELLRALALLPLGAATPTALPLTITNAVTGVPIPYASLGIKNKPIGTVADASGHFFPEAFAQASPTDTMVVSCIGYQSLKLVVADLAKLSISPANRLALSPQTQALSEVVVRSTSWKRHTIGRDGSSGFTFYNFHLSSDKLPANKLGREVGTILHVTPNSFVEEAYVYIRQKSFRHLRFRLNVRALDSQDHPAASLLTQDVQFAVADSTASWQHLDLKPYNINVGPQNRIAVTLEWLDGAPTKQQDWYSVSIPAALSATHRMVFRDKSEDQWKVQPINLSLYITTVSPD
jgi:hypothetical protein